MLDINLVYSVDFPQTRAQPRVSNYHDQYNISWTVQSYEPILEYRLYYRRQRNHSNNLHYNQLVSAQAAAAGAARRFIRLFICFGFGLVYICL